MNKQKPDISLKRTERELILIGMAGLFVFLFFVQAFITIGRYTLELEFQRGDFEGQISTILARNVGTIENQKENPPIGITMALIDASGSLVSSATLPWISSAILNIVDKDTLLEIPIDQTINYGSYYIYKLKAGTESDKFIIFMRKAGYPKEDMLRDIGRLLIFDFILIFPVYFMIRYFVRRTLRPVRENIDAMTHFVQDAGHELKTPLTILSGDLHIIRDEGRLDIELIHAGIRTIKNMRNSIDSLIDLSMITMPEYIGRLDDIRGCIDEEMNMYRKDIEERKLIVNIQVEKDLTLMIDGKHFATLMNNLIKNAILYNKEGGTIDITIDQSSITIEDTGIGIESHNLEKIWDRFYREDRTGKYAGTGIGLSIVERIVSLYGWQISVESERGVGTKFFIRIS